jgi:hypothetical protein
LVEAGNLLKNRRYVKDLGVSRLEKASKTSGPN